MPRSIYVGVVLAFLSGLALADSGSAYRIELVNGGQLASVVAPVQRGSVLTFRSPSGELTGVPAEWVARVVGGPTAAPSPSASRRMVASAPPRREAPVSGNVSTGLEPGDVVVIGPTGDGASMSPAATGAANAAAPAVGVPAGGNGVYGGGTYAPNANAVDQNLVLNPNLTGVGTDGLPRVMSSTDLSRALPSGTTTGANGFPAAPSGALTVIGPNGTPTLAPGVPGSSTPVIGPNGTPVLAQPGQPGSAATQPAIGPNGTPVLAQPGQPGAVAPAIGPNGTPVLAAPGQPGSAAPNTAPNGTPASPASPAPSGGTAGSSPKSR